MVSFLVKGQTSIQIMNEVGTHKDRPKIILHDNNTERQSMSHHLVLANKAKSLAGKLHVWLLWPCDWLKPT